jgi:hypothetical protein
MAVGGGSAERRAEELATNGDSSAGAWAAGAAGERRVAAALADLREAWTVLHDRLLRPGQSDANLDHVVVGPGGLFLVDAKNRAGRVTEWEGGLFQHTVREGQPVSVNLAGELKKVHGMAAYMAAEAGMPVTPALCLAGVHEAEFGEPRMVRGVWVVPVARLVEWLNTRPVMLDREAAARAVTRAMTDFPSTTTDPELLAAIGMAAASAKSGRRRSAPVRRSSPPSSPRRSASRRAEPKKRSVGARLVRGVAALLVMMLALSVGVGVASSLIRAFVHGLSPVSGVSASQPPGPSVRSIGAVPALAPTDCTRVTAAEVTAALRRTVRPIATGIGCTWGSRLDDPATTLVTIQMSASHAAYDTQLETSVKQHRVVYGTGYDGNFHLGTALWVAAGEPISVGPARVIAKADTRVVVATTALGVSDDRARVMALAIARAANGK